MIDLLLVSVPDLAYGSFARLITCGVQNVKIVVEVLNYVVDLNLSWSFVGTLGTGASILGDLSFRLR